MTVAAPPALIPRLRRDLFLRAALIWAGLRLFLATLGVAYGSPSGGLPMSVGVVVLVAAGVLFDVRVCRESLLLANLGVSPLRIAGAALVPAVALETAVLALIRSL